VNLLQHLTAAQSKDYIGVRLGKPNNPNLTLFRRVPKVKGKANVKAAKRSRHRARHAGL
jgi:hypothetical protein